MKTDQRRRSRSMAKAFADKLPKRYPRKVIRVDVTLLRRKAHAITKRSSHDRIVILRCGKPQWTLIHTAYHDFLINAAQPCPTRTLHGHVGSAHMV